MPDKDYNFRFIPARRIKSNRENYCRNKRKFRRLKSGWRLGDETLAGGKVRRAGRPALGKNGLVSIVTTAPNERISRKVLKQQIGQRFFGASGLKGFYDWQSVRRFTSLALPATHLRLPPARRQSVIFGSDRMARNGSANPQDICVERTDCLPD